MHPMLHVLSIYYPQRQLFKFTYWNSSLYFFFNCFPKPYKLNFSCEQDSNLMGSDFDNEESGVSGIKRYWAVLYVFKFYNSNDIFFSCTVTVCPSGASSCDIVSFSWSIWSSLNQWNFP